MNATTEMKTTSFASPVAVDANLIGRMAIRSLYAEVALHPKPGLVSPVDNGSHQDMTMATFMRSMFSLRHYFSRIAASGTDGFDTLKQLGIDAERRMLQATGGVNTHRGAIFSLGLLAAAAGYLQANGMRCAADDVCATVSLRWGHDILQSQPAAIPSNGSAALARHGGDGARQNAAAGFPTLRNLALPCFKHAVVKGYSRERASIQTFFALMAVLNDTNVLHRGGAEGLDFVQQRASRFLEAGGAGAPDWQISAGRIHREFISRRISPGGAADLLACTLFLHDLETMS